MTARSVAKLTAWVSIALFATVARDAWAQGASAPTPAPATQSSTVVTNTPAAVTAPPTPTLQVADGPSRQSRAVVHYERGWAYYALGRYRLAIRELESAVHLDPRGYNLYFDLGLVYERVGEVDRAIGAYRRYYAHAADQAERDRADRIVRRLQGARGEMAEIHAPRRGVADGWFWLTGVLGVSGLAAGATMLILSPAIRPTDGRDLFQISGTISLAVGVGFFTTAAILYASRERPRDRSWLVRGLISGELLSFTF